MFSEATGVDQQALLDRWIGLQTAAAGYRPDRINPGELRDTSREFLAALARAERGFSPSDTATFVFSLKEPLLEQLRASYAKDLPAQIAARRRRTAADV